MTRTVTRYAVAFALANGIVKVTVCAVREGYSTTDDIPKMVELKYGPGTAVYEVRQIDDSNH